MAGVVAALLISVLLCWFCVAYICRTYFAYFMHKPFLHMQVNANSHSTYILHANLTLHTWQLCFQNDAQEEHTDIVLKH